MDDKHSYMEDWLRKAARQTTADDTGGELKRQSWSKMAALLDEEEAGKPKPRIFRFRLNRAAILIPFIATTAVFAAAVWVVPHFSRKAGPAGRSSHVKEQLQHKNNQTQGTLNNNNIPVDTTLTGINSSTPEPNQINGIPAQVAPVLPLPENWRDSAAKAGAAAANLNSLNAANNSTSHSGAGNVAGPVNDPVNANTNRSTKAAANPAKVPAKVLNSNIPALAPAIGKAPAAAVKHKRNLPHNKVNKTAIPGIANDNEPFVKAPTETNKRFNPGKKEKNDNAAVSPAQLYPVPTRNVFALQLASLSDGSRDARVPVLPSGGGLRPGASDSRWGLQLGLLSPLSSALGLRVGVLYMYPLAKGWYLQPQVSASYLTGYNKPFTHVAVSKQPRDTSGGGGPGNYNLDTTRTPYTFQRAFAGSAGINVGYHRNRMTVSSGLVYSMAMASGRRDSAQVSSRIVRDTTGAGPFSDPAFSTGSLPGKNQLSWNVDLSWYVTPRLQAGFNYRVVLWRSAGDRGFQAPLQRIQDNSLLELYIRIPIGK